MSLLELVRQHEEKLRYLCVSAWNFLFGNLVYIGLVTWFAPRGASWLGVPLYEWMLVPMNVIAITNNFLGYKWFVFRTQGNYLREYLRTYAVYVPIVFMQMVALPTLVELLHLDPRIANPIWNVVAFVIAYFAHRLFTFRTAEERLETLDEAEAGAAGSPEDVRVAR